MKISGIKKSLKNHHNTNKPFKEFAVLIPLIEINSTFHVLFEIRAHSLHSQPNEVCFPGGKIELNETPENCARRETHEEILIPYKHIEILGHTDPLITPFNYKLYPFVGLLKNYDSYQHPYNTEEVASLFTVPLHYFLENKPEIHHLETQLLPSEVFPYHKIQNGEAYLWKTADYEVLFYDYKDQVIWGLTAKLLHQFIEILVKDKKNKLSNS